MGWLWTLLLNGMLGLAAYWTARHGFRQPAGLARGLASIVLAWAWVTLGLEILGPPGMLAVGPLALWCVLGLLIGACLRWRDRQPDAFEAIKPADEKWGWGAIVSLGLVLWAATLMGVQSLFFPVKVVSDGPIYHLYFAARWWKEGRLFMVAAPFGENAATYFPAVGDLWFTWLMTTWGGDRLAKVGQAPFLLVAALAAYALARRLGAGSSASVIATAWFVTSTPLFLFSFEPNVDTIFVAGYLMAAFFFLRYGLGDDRAGTLALGGLAAGGALGTKATSLVFIPALLVVSACVVLWSRVSWKRKAGHLAVLALTPMVMAGFWYGRNAVLTANLLYPLQVKLGGRVLFSGWYDSSVMSMSQYYLPFSNGGALVDTLLAVLDPRLAPFWAFALLGGWALGRGRAPLGRWVWGASALAVLNVALYWILIPYRTQQRFMLHALGVAVIPLARMFQLGAGLRAAAVILLAVHLLTPQGWPVSEGNPPWDLSPFVPNAVSSLIMVPRTEAALGILAIGLGALAVAWLWGRAGRPSQVFAALAASAALIAVTSVLSVPTGTDPRRLFYPGFRDYYVGWLNLDLRAGPSGTRIAYAGTNIPYYLLGTNLRNEVRYINIDAKRDWLLHDYHREAMTHGDTAWPNPRPGWDRIHPNYDAWLANLRAERIQILVVARANPAEGPHNIADPEHFPIERQWAESHPETFEPLYGVIEHDPLFRAYRLRPPAKVTAR